MSLKKKLLLSNFFYIIIIIVLVGTSYVALNNTKDLLRTSGMSTVAVSKLIELVNDINQIQLTRTLEATTGMEDKIKSKDKILSLITEGETVLEEEKKNNNLSLIHISDSFNRIKTQIIELYNKISNGAVLEAVEFQKDKLSPLFTLIISELKKEKQKGIDGIVKLNEIAIEKIKQYVMFFGILIIVSLLISAALVGFARNVVNSINLLTSAALDIEKGNYQQQIKIERKDEIGLLTRTFQNMGNAIHLRDKELASFACELEKKVEQRTLELQEKNKNIQSLLKNIKQGIFTITTGGLIHHEYSDYLVEILGTQNIAKENVNTLLFKNSNLGADTASQIENLILTAIGENAITFELNKHLLVRDLEFINVENKKIHLEIDWNPIIGDNDTLERIMCTLRDVTEVKKFRNEAEIKKQDLEIIGEIIKNEATICANFFKTSLNYIDDCYKIASNEAIEKSSYDKILIHLHTIKGNARTLGFSYINNLLHKIEQQFISFKGLLENKESFAQSDIISNQMDFDSKEEITIVKFMLERYQNVNDNVLGRKSNNVSNNEEDSAKLLVVEKCTEMLQKLDYNNIQHVKKVNFEVEKIMSQMSTISFKDILHPTLKSISQLANQLHKQEPQVIINDSGIRFKLSKKNLVNNVFMHLVRNSLDHGIESSEERISKNKNPNPNIFITMELDPKMVLWDYMDDGRGLNLEKIKNKALLNKIINSNEIISDEELANLIFISGLTTAENISDVSGRGIGMDAVKKMIEKEGGNVTLALLEPCYDKNHRSFKLKIKLPLDFIYYNENLTPKEEIKSNNLKETKEKKVA